MCPPGCALTQPKLSAVLLAVHALLSVSPSRPVGMASRSRCHKAWRGLLKRGGLTPGTGLRCVGQLLPLSERPRWRTPMPPPYLSTGQVSKL